MVARTGHEEAPKEAVPRGRGAHPSEQDGEGSNLSVLLFLQADPSVQLHLFLLQLLHVKNRWKDMPTEDVKAILDNLGRSSVIVCSFEGGDPLVRDDIGEILRYQYEKPWYLLFTTSERDMQQRYPMAEYGKYIDFLHISIDEGHKNLDMYDELEEYTKWGSIVTVQIVVTKNDIGALEQKIKRCQDAGVKAVVMCAVQIGRAHV